MTIAAYIITLLLVFFTITTFLQSILSGLLMRFFKMPMKMSSFFGALGTWISINLLWMLILNTSIPIVILLISMIYLFVHYAVSEQELNNLAKINMVAEFWGILLLGIFIIIYFSPIRWF